MPRPVSERATFAVGRLDARLAYGVAGLFGLLLVARIFPPDALNGTLTLTHPLSGDTAQHVAGQRYLFADLWRWPPVVTRLIEPPAGVNVGLTDSIPLMALLAKPFAGLFPPGAHFIYFWVALCYVLQPMAAVFAVRSAGSPGLAANLAAAVFAVCMPAFIFRFGHPALCGHFFVLAAIGVYFCLVAHPQSYWWLAAAGLMVCGLLVHPYLAAMVAGITAAAPLSLLGRAQWRAALALAARLAVAAAVLAGVMAGFGYLGTDQALGFGRYSLNLLSPIVPAGSSLIGGFPMMDATGGQYEGYSYLGLGLAALALLAAVQLWRAEAWVGLSRHAGLVLAAVGALVFAVSDRVYFGRHLLFNLPIVPDALRQFRASGRFVWVDLYLLLVGAICLLCRVMRPSQVAALLGALAALQFVDTRVLRGQVARQMIVPTAWSVDPGYYRPLLARHTSVELWPTAACQPEMVSNPVFMHLLLLASERAIPINTIPVARTPGHGDCQRDGVSRASLQAGELRLLLPGSPPNLVAGVPALRPFCHYLPNGIIGCSKDPALAATPTVEPSAFVVGRILSLNSAAGEAVRGVGWTSASVDGAWTLGEHATLLGTIDPASTALRLRITGHALARGDAAQTVEVAVNGHPIATWHVAQGDDRAYEASLPDGTSATGSLIIDLTIIDPVRADDVLKNGDLRPLGFFVRDFSLDRT